MIGELDFAAEVNAGRPAEDAEEAKRVRAALAELPDNQRHVLCLAFFTGLTHEQIAGDEDVPLGTVTSRIRRGMDRLRELLLGETEWVKLKPIAKLPRSPPQDCCRRRRKRPCSISRTS